MATRQAIPEMMAASQRVERIKRSASASRCWRSMKLWSFTVPSRGSIQPSGSAGLLLAGRGFEPSGFLDALSPQESRVSAMLLLWSPGFSGW